PLVIATGMKPAQQHHAGQTGAPATDPGVMVVRLRPARRNSASGIAAEPVPDFQGPAQPGRRRPVLPTDVDRKAVTLDDRDDLRVAANPARGSRRQSDSVLEVAKPVG